MLQELRRVKFYSCRNLHQEFVMKSQLFIQQTLSKFITTSMILLVFSGLFKEIVFFFIFFQQLFLNIKGKILEL